MYICTRFGEIMKDIPDYVLLHRIAYRYYIEGCSQQLISRQENISRPHVSRLLSRARQLGIVKIKVDFPQSLEFQNLSEQLERLLDLQEVILVAVPDEYKNIPVKVSEMIGEVAGQRISGLLGNAKNIGVGWGCTIYHTALKLPKINADGARTFIPLVGISDESNKYFQSNVIVDRFAEKFSAQSFYTSVPVFNQSDFHKQPVEKNRYDRLMSHWENLDAVVIGLGPKYTEGEFLISEASEEYKQLIATSDVVGDILARFFYEDGTVLDSSAYYEQISLPLERLKAIPTVICLAGGEAKVPGLIAAARQGYFKTLLTDQYTARSMIYQIQCQ